MNEEEPTFHSVRTQQSVVRTVAAVLVAFVLCWMPFFLVYTSQAFEVCAANRCISPFLGTPVTEICTISTRHRHVCSVARLRQFTSQPARLRDRLGRISHECATSLSPHTCQARYNISRIDIYVPTRRYLSAKSRRDAMSTFSSCNYGTENHNNDSLHMLHSPMPSARKHSHTVQFVVC